MDQAQPRNMEFHWFNQPTNLLNLKLKKVDMPLTHQLKTQETQEDLNRLNIPLPNHTMVKVKVRQEIMVKVKGRQEAMELTVVNLEVEQEDHLVLMEIWQHLE